WLVLVMSSRDVGFARIEPLVEDGVYLVKTRHVRLGLDRADLDLDLAPLRQIDRFDGTKDPILVNSVNRSGHDETSVISGALARFLQESGRPPRSSERPSCRWRSRCPLGARPVVGWGATTSVPDEPPP